MNYPTFVLSFSSQTAGRQRPPMNGRSRSCLTPAPLKGMVADRFARDLGRPTSRGQRRDVTPADCIRVVVDWRRPLRSLCRAGVVPQKTKPGAPPPRTARLGGCGRDRLSYRSRDYRQIAALASGLRERPGAPPARCTTSGRGRQRGNIYRSGLSGRSLPHGLAEALTSC